MRLQRLSAASQGKFARALSDLRAEPGYRFSFADRHFERIERGRPALRQSGTRKSFGAFGGGGDAPSADGAGRAFQRVRGLLPFLFGMGGAKLLQTQTGLRAEEPEHFPFERPLAEREIGRAHV